ncbi:hypothetical protein GCM10009738_00310 [Kitasatospora viridis]|uniref:MFS transporter n=1 Tax=Kitasatospora viridis TaxID=281105 RepID=A0A561SEW6_9ACTN|nr:hypothetical protein FHX73_1525 [Kitasatospora viridis]
MTTTVNPERAPGTTRSRLPLSPLLALATAVFLTSLTETLPAGLLPGMSASLRVGESAMGQAVTVTPPAPRSPPSR